MANCKVLERLGKLLRLTKSSNEHESRSAQSKLENLAAKYNVDLNDIHDSSEVTTRHWYRYQNAYDKSLLEQIGYMVKPKGYKYTNQSKQRQIGYDLTPSERIELELYWFVLGKKLLKDLDNYVGAFIHANDLYANEESDEDEDEVPQYSVEQLMEFEEQLRMSETIGKTEVFRQVSKKELD